MRSLRLLAVLALVGCVACAVSACRSCDGTTPDQNGEPAADAARTFGIALWEPETIDPSLASEEAGVTITSALFEGLLARPPGAGPMRPGVAREWGVGPDGVTWTFRLRPDARWTDGRPVTAHDFEYAIRRVLDPATGSRSAQQVFMVAGAEAFFRGKADAAGVGVRATDDSTLVVTLERPLPYFPEVVAYAAWLPVRRDVVETHGNRWTRPGNIVSNGPFRLVEMKPGVHAIVERNPTWHAAGSVALDRVTFHFLTDQNLAYEWYRAGKVQWMKGTLSRDRIPELRRERPSEFHADPVLCTYYAVLRTDRPPFDDVRLRRALDLSIDKERFVREVLMGGQAPARSLVPPAIREPTGYVPADGPSFDPDAAKALLAEYVRDRGAPPRFSYLYNSGEAHRLIAEYLQAEWRKHLGLDVSVEAVEWKTLLERLRKGDFQAARATWCADFVDPVNYLEVFRSGGPNDYPAFADPAFDAAVDAAQRAGTWPERMAAARRAEDLLVAATPLVPLYFYTRLYLLDPSVRGFEANVLDVHPLQYIERVTGAAAAP